MVLHGYVRGKDIVTSRYGHFKIEGWKDLTPSEKGRLKGKKVKFVRVTDTRFTGRGTTKSQIANTADQHVRELGRILEILPEPVRSRSLSTVR